MNEPDLIKTHSTDVINIENSDCPIIIRYPHVNYSYWKSLIPHDSDEETIIILENLLIDLDCTIIFNGMRLLMTNHMNYERFIADYYYYLLHINNYVTYNEYFDKLLNIHKDNVYFELNNPIVKREPIIKAKKAVKAKSSSKFVRQATTDMFDGKEVYIYSNSKTGEVINSEDPNLLETLNAPAVKVKKEKQSKSAGVPMAAMEFMFTKKK